MLYKGLEMPVNPKFRFLEYTADIYIAAYGNDLKEAFENAAHAAFEAMTDTRKIAQKLENTIEVKGHDEESLLYNWLEALIINFETAEMLYSEFKILKLKKIKGDFKLKAIIKGEKFNPKKHISKLGVKAVTYHRMEIVKRPNKVTMKFVLDI